MRAEAASIRATAKRLSALKPKSVSHVALIGMLAGAAYSLLEACSLDYIDDRSDPSAVPFADEFAQTLDALAAEKSPPVPWRSGYYFNSALMRLDAVDTRLAELIGAKPLYDGPVRLAVNSLKHDVDAHVSGQHTASFAEAVTALERLSGLLATAVQ